jgi:hypothetical protein
MHVDREDLELILDVVNDWLDSEAEQGDYPDPDDMDVEGWGEIHRERVADVTRVSEQLWLELAGEGRGSER